MPEEIKQPHRSASKQDEAPKERFYDPEEKPLTMEELESVTGGNGLTFHLSGTSLGPEDQ